MQRGIGKHGIKFMLKRQLLPIALHGMDAQTLRRSHQIGAAVQAEHLGAGGGDFCVSTPSPQPKSNIRSPLSACSQSSSDTP